MSTLRVIRLESKVWVVSVLPGAVARGLLSRYSEIELTEEMQGTF